MPRSARASAAARPARPSRDRPDRRGSPLDERQRELVLLDPEQVLDRLRERAVAILGGGAQLAELVVVLRQGDAAVEVDLEASASMYVAGTYASTRASTRTGRTATRLAHGLGDRLVQHLDVELEAEGRDVTGLLRAQGIAGAADLEVAHRDLEAGSELSVWSASVARRARASAVSSLASGYRRYAWAVTSERPANPRIW